jgi:hypothetical protein
MFYDRINTRYISPKNVYTQQNTHIYKEKNTMGKLESERKKLPKKAQQKEHVYNVVIGPDDEGDPEEEEGEEEEPSKTGSSLLPSQPKPQKRTAARKKGRK